MIIFLALFAAVLLAVAVPQLSRAELIVIVYGFLIGLPLALLVRRTVRKDVKQ